jgi:hypothetical protein
MMSGSIDAECASVGPLNSGTISPLRAQPPTFSVRSSTSVFNPREARNAAVTRPL